MSRRRFLLASALAVASVALLVSCAGPGITYADLQGDREASDELPQLKNAYDSVDAASSRFVGEYDGTSLWLAHGNQQASLCLIADAGSGKWVVACSGDTVEIDGVAGNFVVLPDGAPVPEGATKVSENVYAK